MRRLRPMNKATADGLPPARQRERYAAVSLLAAATLMFEILLTRIFSVTLWYHFAFVAVSIAMFGLSVGALIVFLWPERLC